VRERLRLAQDRLLSLQSPEGFYLYEYDPLKNTTSKGYGNLVRQAGTAYAMSRSATAERNRKRARQLRESASRAIAFLLGFGTLSPDGSLSLLETESPEEDRGKLGTLALTLLAMHYGDLLQNYPAERDALASSFLGFQNRDGSFRCYADSKTTAGDGTSQDYFPGQALLALVHEGRQGRTGCLEAVEAAFDWYRNYFWRNPATAFVYWQTDAWRQIFELFSERPGLSRTDPSKYAYFVFEMADWLLQYQIVPTLGNDDSAGGFAPGGRKPGSSTATYCEAIIRAYGLARYLGMRTRMKSYRESARRALFFLSRLQIVPETASLFVEPELVTGGTTRNLSDFTIRCDNDQHLVTALLAAMETRGFVSPSSR
jgi:hypothetical protein